MNKKQPSRHPHNWENLVDEFRHTSDRAVVILGCTYLKNHLDRLIRSFLIDDQETANLLLGPEAPIETFGAHIKAAYALGLISPNEFHDLSLILQIRNAFLDEFDSSKLTDNGIDGMCFALRIPRGVLLSEESKTPRRLFEFAAALIAGQLIVRAGHAENERRTLPKNFVQVNVER